MQAKVEWLEAYLEQLLRQHLEAEPITDGDGDFPFRWGTAACWVSLQMAPRWRVQVFAHAAHGVKQSARLLREVNDVNARLVDGRVYWRGGVVLVETSIEAASLDAASLDNAARVVGSTADDVGGLIAAMFDGSTPYPAELGA